MFLSLLITVVITAIIFLLIGWTLNSSFGKKSVKSAKDKEKEIIENANIEAENLKKERLLEADEEYYNLKQTLEEEFRTKKRTLQKEEQRLNEKDTNIDRKSDFITKKEQELNLLENELRSLYQTRTDKTIFIRADESTSYRDVLRVIDIAKGAGIEVMGVMLDRYKTGE